MEKVIAGNIKNSIRPKGQMFLIATILILVTFFALRNMLDVYDVFEEKRSQEIKTENFQIRNMVKEYEYTAGIASMQPDVNRTAQDYLFNFSTFIRDVSDVKVLYVFVYSNSTTGKYSVVIGNFLSDNVNGTINATNSQPSSFQFLLRNKRDITKEFNFTVNGSAELNLTYTTKNEVRRDTMNITLQSPGYFASLLTDITAEGNDIKVRYKDIYNRTWRVP
ncbi:MAG: hypothetical protein QMD85_01300 [Candidatus Aenigmarchaeota archaeon]|nr:hypothetical protein [Candidatus Aenigmarchaeota archaeon]MDI6722188.1 hypothetical protein [Candidatus Aenigmarchaeota archaeon]